MHPQPHFIRATYTCAATCFLVGNRMPHPWPPHPSFAGLSQDYPTPWYLIFSVSTLWSMVLFNAQFLVPWFKFPSNSLIPDCLSGQLPDPRLYTNTMAPIKHSPLLGTSSSCPSWCHGPVHSHLALKSPLAEAAPGWAAPGPHPQGFSCLQCSVLAAGWAAWRHQEVD